MPAVRVGAAPVVAVAPPSAEPAAGDNGFEDFALASLTGTPSGPRRRQQVAAPLNAPVEISLPVCAVSTNGAPAEGTYSFALDGASTNSVIHGSRESANPPQLVVTTG